MKALLVRTSWPKILDTMLQSWGGVVVVAADGHYLTVAPGVYVVRALPSQSLDFLRRVIASAGGSGISSAPDAGYGMVVGACEMGTPGSAADGEGE